MAIALGAVAGCGDDEQQQPGADAGVDAPPVVDECDALALTDRQFHHDLFGQISGVSYAVAPGVGGEAADRLLVELYDSTTPGLAPLEAGTFPLDQPLASCQHCVWIPVDWNGVDPITTVMVATEGEMTLTSVEDPLGVVFAGSVAGVVLREATLDENGGAVLVDGGACARIESHTFDTSPTPGAACLSAEDCGNYLLEICDPHANLCAAPQCGESAACGPDEVCVAQIDFLMEGACYAMCDPTDPGLACDESQECVQLGVDPTFGVCKTRGTGAVGAACELEDNGTSCVSGATCSPETQHCTNTCAYFTDAPGCEDGAQCTVLGYCAPPPGAADVGVGEACGDGAAFVEWCAADGDAYRGLCFSYDGPLTCERACFDDLGCDFETEFCALRFTSGLGVCQPIPVCGDGVLGEINELCDDGNTTGGDGCSALCDEVEYDVICGGLSALSGDATLGGDTAGGWDGFQASCQLGLARAELVDFTPPGYGRLRAWVDSTTAQVVSLRDTCADSATELACATNVDFVTDVTHQVTDPAAALTLMVSAWTILEEGPYTLHVEWTDEVCGDGIVAGREVCDDTNTAAGDGCSADCRAIEYDVVCAGAATLTVGAPYSGDNTGGTNVFASMCSNDVYGSGHERLHTITAPSAGTLWIRLDQGFADLTLAAYDTCGDPVATTELDCSSVYGIEEIEVAVTAGQTVTVLVEGFSIGDVGPYTITTELVP